MFGENRSVRRQSSLGGKIVSAVLVFSFVMLSATVRAQSEKSGSVSRNALKQRFVSDVRLDGFDAEIFSGATKISWKTSFEQNTLGFKVWRENKGERVLVNENMVTGSLLKVADGVLPAGSEYSFYDLDNSADACYWLEAIDVNGESRWFGPAFPQVNFNPALAETEEQIIAELKNGAKEQRRQTETVEFDASEKRAVEAAPTVEADLLTNDPNALKIEVRADGFYRVDAQTLTGNGFNVAQSARWKLFKGGVEQPIVVNSDGSIDFYGEAVETIQTAANVYWLMTDTSNGKRIKRVAQKYLNSARITSTRVTVERKDKIYRVSSILNGARENWYGEPIYSTVSNQTLVLSNIDFNSRETAAVGVDLQGLTAVSHQVTVLLNGVSVGQINFSLFDRAEWTTNVALSRLVEGTNTITLQAVGGSQDINITEAVRISYPRVLEARENRMDFGVPGGQSLKLRGFTTAQIRLLDVTNPAQITELAPQSKREPDGTYSVTLSSVNNNRLMTALGANTPPLTPAAFVRNNPSDLRNTQNQGKFLVIAPGEYKDLLNSFCAARSAGGIQTQFVDVEDIYDEFNSGVKSAEAIRSFLQYAKQSWSVKPDFVMFVGDATVDPRNYSGFGGYTYNRVPTMLVDTWNMETVSDEMLADFNNDGIGEIATGRLPAKDEAELQGMLEKIMNTRPLTRTEISQRGVHFVSDALIGYDFAAGSRNMATYFPSTVTVSYLDAAGQDAGTIRSNIISRINSGPALVNYFGHASVGVWANNQIFRNVDVPNLTNSQGAPFMAMINCLNGDYAEPNMNSLAEAAMKQRFGGASAVWAASGYNGAQEQEFYTKDFYKKVFQGMPLGEAARQTKMLYPNLDLRRTYVFFGDPTQPLVTQ